MTREAIEYFKFHRKIFCEDHLKNCPKDSLAYHATIKEKEFYDMAIKALEQEPVLDKIRAEIEQIEINGHIRDVECFRAGINTVLNVINKYRAESEK